ncbi:MAG TPA: hypothetical protein PL124_07465 [Candidatus Cloacimonadota bacterium]|nr:hypothetical protein [Candidatus Cloacimonadota bacterium]
MANSISQYIGEIQNQRAAKLQQKMQAFLPFIDHQIQKKATEEAETKRRTKVENDISTLAAGYDWTPEETNSWVESNKGLSTESLPASFELANSKKQKVVNRTKLENDLRIRAKMHGYSDEEADAFLANNAGVSDKEVENLLDIDYKNRNIDTKLKMYGATLPTGATQADKQDILDSYEKATDLGEWGFAKFKEAAKPGANLKSLYSDVKADVTYRETVQQKFGTSNDTYVKKYDELRNNGVAPAAAFGKVAKIWDDNQPKGSTGGNGGETKTEIAKRQKELEDAAVYTETVGKDTNQYVIYPSSTGQTIKVPVFKNRNGVWVYKDQPDIAVDFDKVYDYKAIDDPKNVPVVYKSRPGKTGTAVDQYQQFARPAGK